jgi:tRNA-binding protein
MEKILWDDFEKVVLCVGTVIEADLLQKAKKPAYGLKIDFGEWGIKNSSAQITHLYTVDELVGKQIVAVVNFHPKQIGPFISECLVTGFLNASGHVVLAIPEKLVENGARMM